MAASKTARGKGQKKLPLKPAAKTATAETNVTYATPRKLLLAPYAIIPASLLVILVDQLFLGRWIQGHFPTLPEDLTFFVIFFNLPHITASTVTFFDSDYIKHYGWRFIAPIVVLSAILVGFPGLIYRDDFTAVLYLWTVIHVVGQQFGLTRMLGAGFDRLYFFWKWTSLALGVLIYFGIYAGMINSSQGAPMLSAESRHLILIAGCAMLVPVLALSWFVYRQAKTTLGRMYVFGNSFTMVCVVALYAAHYPFFVILIPRVLHDFSAFIFYISHDMNRNKEKVRNVVYRALRFSRIPIYVLCPLIAIGLAFPISYYAYLQNVDRDAQGWAYRLLVLITLLHYYSDSFVWKNGALHRQYIRLM